MENPAPIDYSFVIVNLATGEKSSLHVEKDLPCRTR